MPKKTYRAVFVKSLSIPVIINHKTVFCEFTGGMSSPRPINGSFTTTNKDIQKELEGSGSFGFRYKLESEELLPTEVMVGKKVAEVKEKESDDTGHIRNFMSAKSYLKEKGVPWGDMKTKTDVLNKAKELGITFSSWK
jgi:hypothetical protein